MSEHFPPPAPTSSNQREMLAVLRAHLHFLPTLEELQIKVITLESDNMTVVHNILKAKAQIGSLPIVRALFSFITRHRIILLPIHRPGIRNEKTDALTRLEWLGDYQIQWELISPILQEWKITPTIHLFATKANHKLPLYCPAVPTDQDAFAYNAFSIPWVQFPWPYIHTTPTLIPSCLQRIEMEQILALMTESWEEAKPSLLRG
jgi:hypothetical protein